MSKLIVEMEMPRNCRGCALSTGCSFCEGYDDYCVLAPSTAEYEWNFWDGIEPSERPSWCPIKGVLPDEHGDLIDRDELKKQCWHDDGFEMWVSHAEIDQQPTVVAAERKDE